MGQLGDISPQGSVAIGIIVGLLSTSIQSLGLTLQRQSHLLEESTEFPETRRPPYKRRRWQLGMSMFVVSNLVGSTIQITTLPLPVLSTLQASGLVFNSAFATLLLKEPFTRFSMVGTILTCAGAGLIAAFGAIGEPAHSLRQLLDLLAKRGFIIWMIVTMLVVAGTIIFAHMLKVYSSYKHMSKHIAKATRPRSNSKPAAQIEPRNRRLSFTAQLPRPLQLKVTRLRVIRGLSYALISGILSAHSLLVAKSAVELIVRTIIDHDNQFNCFQSWLILLALLFFALSQLYYMHLGLRLCSTSVLYPFVFCIYNIVAILDGLIYFRQASRLSALHGGLIAVGTVILLSGVLALSWRLDDTSPAEPAPQVMDPQTPLTPGMGLIRNSDDSERSPLLPVARSSSTSFGFGTGTPTSERTPLLNKPVRKVTLTKSSISHGGAATRDIWAELDDDDDYGVLTDLPRSTSSLLPRPRDNLSVPKKRRRASLPSKENRTASDPQPISRSKRSHTLQAYSQKAAENTVAMLKNSLPTDASNDLTEEPTSTSQSCSRVGLGLNIESSPSSPRKISRDRRVTVRFEDGEGESKRNHSPRSSRKLLGDNSTATAVSGSDDKIPNDNDKRRSKEDGHENSDPG